ncbi:hypothetical protein WH43_15990 [Rheinheimera sp. KL1]|uniref:hypothetical protein n=1 Tax=Rheinheimera sp. KL1 TaxID=1635005 RepID=UPI0006A984B6|nr:hypothetical protein [Rheinheimera sp. KL1]KOO57137.1 hypothetical protein WH43_15990 [Rheinheimera sp. KL1]
MKNILITLSLTFCYFSPNVLANDLYETCNSCTAPLQYYQKMQDAAAQQVTTDGYKGKVVVANFKQGIAYAWDVNAYYKWSSQTVDPSIEFRASVSLVPTDIQNLVTEISQHQIMRMASSVVHVDVNSGFTSAWEIARNPSSRDKLEQWFHDAYPIRYWVTNLGSSAGGIRYDFLSGTEYIFKFADGSKITMTAPSAQSASLKFSYKAGSAQDLWGNTIFDAGYVINGTYHFPNNYELQNFLDKAAQYGIGIRVGGAIPRIHITEIPTSPK